MTSSSISSASGHSARGLRSAAQQRAGTLLVVLRALHDHVEQDLERGLAELALLRPDVHPARPEVEKRVGMNMVDADASLLEVAPLLRRRRTGRVEPALQAIDIAGPPGTRLTVGAVPAPLEIVVVVGDVPVADVDHVQHAMAVLATTATADRLLEEQPERPRRNCLRRQATTARTRLQLEPAATKQHRPHHRLREHQPALRIEHEVILKTLRNQHITRCVVPGPLSDTAIPSHPTGPHNPCQADDNIPWKADKLTPPWA